MYKLLFFENTFQYVPIIVPNIKTDYKNGNCNTQQFLIIEGCTYKKHSSISYPLIILLYVYEILIAEMLNNCVGMYFVNK